ncbi:MAG TPA: hypothetical protein PKD73_12505, partial [Burkholderiaceae bacterium]|nr:hypothetical protein [Burkholderiaceae bacterium]
MPIITGTTRVFFILGDPVAQVRAPEVYNHLFQQHGIDAVLVPLKLSGAKLPAFLEHGIAAENIGGLWATIPHKAQLYDLIQPSDPVAQVAGKPKFVLIRPKSLRSTAPSSLASPSRVTGEVSM